MIHAPQRILLVDDDQDILTGVSCRLRGAGYDTLTADNGADGLASAVFNRPDAIVLDVRMPAMDGLTTLEKLHELQSTRDIPVVMLSASLVDQQAALDAGAKFFLTKPYRGPTLLAALEAVLRRN